MDVKLYADIVNEMKYIQKSTLDPDDAFIMEEIIPKDLDVKR